MVCGLLGHAFAHSISRSTCRRSKY
jgi:hypothetical protein